MSRFSTFVATFGMISGAIASANADDHPRLRLVNDSGQSIDIIQISPVAAPNWGFDFLGHNASLGAGASLEVAPWGSGCQFDVRVTYHDGMQEGFHRIDLCHVDHITFRHGGSDIAYTAY
jgi:hypothetical protein